MRELCTTNQTEGFHLSKATLSPGSTIGGRFFAGEAGDASHLMLIVRDVLGMGADAIRLLMLFDDLMFERFPAWKDGGLARTDKALQELIFETVHTTNFPDKPSRVGGAFLFPTVGHAERFRDEIQGGAGHIYKCSIAQESPFVGDMELIEAAEPHRSIEEELARIRVLAERYWAGEMGNDSWPEIVAPPNSVTVLNEVR